MHRVGDRQKPVSSRPIVQPLAPARLETPLETTQTAAEARRADNKRYRGDSDRTTAILE